MKVTIAYIYPAMDARTYRPMARRFVDNYMRHPPGECDHHISVLVNGGMPSMQRNYEMLFKPLPCDFFYHNNVGKDVGAYQAAAHHIKSDLMVCLGSPVRPRRAGWLDVIVRAYEQNGPGLYGNWAFHEPRDHIRTTAFWLPPQLLTSYPFQIVNENRYEFEHGTQSIRAYTESLGLNCLQVTWAGCFSKKDWHHVPADHCLFLDQHTDRIGLV